MRRKRIEKSLKAKILSESLKEGCVITQLAKEYGVSKGYNIWVGVANIKNLLHLHVNINLKLLLCARHTRPLNHDLRQAN